MTQNLFESLLDIVQKNGSDRFLLGICGAPGAGKSTLAEKIVKRWNQNFPDQAILIPMDGYHFSNEELQHKDLLPLKGVPDTFDADAFVQKLSEIRFNPQKNHFCPRFDRSIEASIQNAIEVLPSHKLLVTEGNYLLLERFPWNKIRNLLDQVWYINASEELILPRLIQRHESGGKSKEAALAKVETTDLPNARLVAQSSKRADRVLQNTELEL